MELALERRRFVAATFALALAAGLFAAWVGLGVGGHTATLWFADTATPPTATIASPGRTSTPGSASGESSLRFHESPRRIASMR